MDTPTPSTHGSLIDDCFIIGGIVESIDANSYPEDRAKLGIRDQDKGYSLIVVPRALGRRLSIGDVVSITVAVQ